MKKRFTDCDIWDDPWYRKMPTIYKEFWRFLCAKCDAVGVWKIDLEGAGFFLREQISEKEAMSQFNNGKERVKPIGENEWFITGFVEFQYGALSKGCPAHKPIYALIEKHGPDRLGIGYLIGYKYPSDRVQEEEKEKNKINIPSSSSQLGFNEVWKIYPADRRGEIGDAMEAWAKATPPTWAHIALKKQAKSDRWKEENGKWIPGLPKWINGHQWDKVLEDHKIVNCSVCGKEGLAPKGSDGASRCPKCKEQAVAAQIEGDK